MEEALTKLINRVHGRVSSNLEMRRVRAVIKAFEHKEHDEEALHEAALALCDATGVEWATINHHFDAVNPLHSARTKSDSSGSDAAKSEKVAVAATENKLYESKRFHESSENVKVMRSKGVTENPSEKL